MSFKFRTTTKSSKNSQKMDPSTKTPMCDTQTSLREINTDRKRAFLEPLFFWASGVICLITFSSIMGLSAYWEDRWSANINTYYPFVYMAGATISFLLFDCYNRAISFFLRIYLIPSLMVLGLVFLCVLGELVDKGTLKNVLFCVTVFLAGFLNEAMQFTLVRYVFFGFNKFRYCSSLGYREMAEYNNGTSLSSVLVGILGFIINFWVESLLYAVVLNIAASCFILCFGFPVAILYFRKIVFGTQ
jgi:hypothetical protein